MQRHLLQSEHLPLALCVLYFIALAPFAEGFASAENLGNLLAAMLPLLVLATGQTVVMIAAGIDLAATSVIALASVCGAMVMTSDGGWLAGSPLAVPVAVMLMLAVGAGVGAVHGALITRLRLPPFIVTLTGMMFFSGVAVWLTRSKSIGLLPESFLRIGGTPWIAALVAALAVGAAHLLLTRTLFGRWLFAVGHNPQTARISGVPVNRVLRLAYIGAGLAAGLGAVLITGRLESGSPIHWQKNLLDIIGATVIGGTSLYGGKGKVLWTLYGVLFLTLIDNSLNLLNLSYFSIMMVKGGVILLASLLDAVRNQMALGSLFFASR